MDEQSRQMAIDVSQSFIVQAPAGSGKTELLTQRFLSLLLTVSEPEEVMAVTFTKKAANEMRHRIIGYIRAVKSGHNLESYQKTTQAIVEKVIQCDNANNWDLTNNPGRLRIQTIDALCHSIAKRTPLGTQMGADFDVAANAYPLYEQAIEQLLEDDDPNIQEAIKATLLHCDNRFESWKQLFIDMLKTREQWLGYIVSANQEKLIEHFDAVVIKQVESYLNFVSDKLGEQKPALQEWFFQCAKICDEHQTNDMMATLAQAHNLLTSEYEALGNWKVLQSWLQTTQNKWRARLDKNQGVLSPSSAKTKEEKSERTKFKESLQAVLIQVHNVISEDDIAKLSILPEQLYQESNKQILSALLILLPRLVSHLKLVFQVEGQIDFIEMMQNAFLGLGTEESPTDTAIYLDYKLSHILIDEYQDTSVQQYKFFSQLISQWQQGDGKTLFLVGDPMQSIYRFRGAEVGVFLHTKQYGMANIMPEFLQLHNNYRSQKSLIDWANTVFKQVLPLQDNIQTGEISYCPSSPSRDATSEPVEYQAFFQENQQEAWIVDSIASLLKTDNQMSIAVLAAKKKSLRRILDQLVQANIPAMAHEVLPLNARPHVQDLYTLLKASLDFHDDIAWYALLRAPFVGLSLHDCYTVSKQNGATVWEKAQNWLQVAGDPAENFLMHFVHVMQYWLYHKDRKPLHLWLQGIWISLHAPRFYSQSYILKEIELFLTHLQQYCSQCVHFDMDDFTQLINQVKVDIDKRIDDAGYVDCMTIHKAKGLEYDHVFLLDCQDGKEKNTQPLLVWHEFTNDEQMEYMLASKKAHGQESDAIYQYLLSLNKLKSNHESARLLYVAATRAKQKLWLSAKLDVKTDQKSFTKPNKNSFLHMLWFVLEDKTNDCFARRAVTNDNDTSISQELPYMRERLCKNIVMPEYMEQPWTQEYVSEGENIPEPQSPFYALVGTIFHQFLQCTPYSKWRSISQQDSARIFAKHLRYKGITGDAYELAQGLLWRAIDNMQQDSKAEWIFNQQQRSRHHEWSIIFKDKSRLKHICIDCSFIDENNNRWIVDYKMALPGENFCLQEQANEYLPQLLKYQQTVANLEGSKPKIALYFPLIPAWWEYHEQKSA